jgi:hypothetical protein
LDWLCFSCHFWFHPGRVTGKVAESKQRNCFLWQPAASCPCHALKEAKRLWPSLGGNTSSTNLKTNSFCCFYLFVRLVSPCLREKPMQNSAISLPRNVNCSCCLVSNFRPVTFSIALCLCYMFRSKETRRAASGPIPVTL